MPRTRMRSVIADSSRPPPAEMNEEKLMMVIRRVTCYGVAFAAGYHDDRVGVAVKGCGNRPVMHGKKSKTNRGKGHG
jgi:hypothetical protein